MICSLCDLVIPEGAQLVYTNSRYWIYKVENRVHQVSRLAVTRSATKTKKAAMIEAEPEPELIGAGEVEADLSWTDVAA